ncbi:MAG TPA: hypothetical protein VMU42_07640, partial [Candidatus Sulfotelmatobacter sp.]|nr:hypothetical protein [Candidatus Sulfotelmatobacter sp.]
MTWTRWAILLGALAFAAGAEAAETLAPKTHDAAPPPAACQVPDSLLGSDGKLPAVRAELAAHRPVRMIVVGTASSMGAGVSAPQKAYPERLQAVLSRRLPVKVSVLNKSKLHDTAAEMLHRFQNEI